MFELLQQAITNHIIYLSVDISSTVPPHHTEHNELTHMNKAVILEKVHTWGRAQHIHLLITVLIIVPEADAHPQALHNFCLPPMPMIGYQYIIT